MKRNLLLLICIVFSSVSHSQQPWTKKQGEGYAQIGSNFFTYGSTYDTPTSYGQSARSIVQLVFSGYAEFGITDRLMLTANVPFQYIRSGKADTSVMLHPSKGWMTGFGNIHTALTFRLFKKGSFTGSISCGYNAKSARRVDASGLQTGYQAHGVEPMLLAGWGFETSFLSLGVGSNIRTHGYLPQFILKGQYGSRFGKRKRAWFIFSLNNVIPLTLEETPEIRAVDGAAYSNYLYRNQQGYLSFDIKLGLEFGKTEEPLWSSWLSLGGGPGWNVGRAPVFNLSLARKFGVGE